MPHLPGPVLALMARQHGLVTRSQLLAAGVGAAVLDGWIRRGALERVARGIYRLPAVVAAPEQRALTAVLRCGAGARAGGATSCWLYGLEGFGPPEPTDVVVPPPRHPRRDRLPYRVRATTVARVDRAVVRGVPCLTATRALIDVTPALPEKAVRVALDSARRLRLTSLLLLDQRTVALQHLHGARLLRRLLESGRAAPESEGERAMQGFLAPLGLDLEWGVTDLVPGRRLDAAYRAGLVGFEYDGRDHHVLPTDRDADGLRDLEAADRDVLILRVTAGMMRDAPAATLERIARICATRVGQARLSRRGGGS